MQYILKRFYALNSWVKIILYFCLFGTLVNLLLVLRDFSSSGVLLRLHAGFLVLYASQAVFMLLHERLVGILALLQGILALLTNADFTFVPLLRVLGQFYYVFNATPSVEALTVYKYVFVSAAFTLQMLCAYALFTLLPKSGPKKPNPAPAQEA